MTHEEAISVYKGMQSHVGEHHRIHEALNVAIEAVTKVEKIRAIAIAASIINSEGAFDMDTDEAIEAIEDVLAYEQVKP